MSKEQEKRPISKIQWGLFIIAMLSLAVTFLGINLKDISSYISGIMFPKADYRIESWTTPPFSLTTGFLESLSTSPEYFVITSVNLKSDRPYYGEPLQFSISFENKGKKSVEQPRVVIFFSDYIYRVWYVWNESITDDVFIRGCSFEYHFPPLDQKTIGAWNLMVLLYDDSEGVLVSYVLRSFTTTDASPKPWWQSFVEGLAFIGGVIILIKTLDVTQKWKRKRKKEALTKLKAEYEKKERKKLRLRHSLIY